jgi:hypothetical protein
LGAEGVGSPGHALVEGSHGIHKVVDFYHAASAACRNE